MVELGLATWALVWMLSFWHKTEWLRERLGVFPVFDETGEQVDREDMGSWGSWLNCPLCTAVLALPITLFSPKKLRRALAGLGLTLLVVRWWEATRPKARWWE